MSQQQLIDRVIVSSDDSPTFLNFWPVVSQAWRKFFPGVTPTLAFVTNRYHDDPLFEKLRSHGDVVALPEVAGVPAANQAKVARFLVAATMGAQVCTIEDIDTVPLQRKYYADRFAIREPGKILAIGHEVFANGPHSGKFPISNITSEGHNFATLFNPNSLPHGELIESFIGMKVVDHKEDIANRQDNFSDESMIRGLIHKHDLHHLIQKVKRDVDIQRDWIDRSWWGVDKARLMSGEYVACNFLRPCRENAQKFVEIYEYLYGRLPKSNELYVI